MSDVFTVPSPETGQPVDGYIVIVPLSEASKRHIYTLQAAIQARFPDNTFWFPRGDELHITFAPALTSNTAFAEDPGVIWRRIGGDVRTALRNCIPDPLSIPVTFNKAEAFPPALIISGKDDGTCRKLRNDFLQGFELPQGSRRPPEIIHITIARFYDEMDFSQVQDFVATLEVSFIETIKEVRLVHETGLYMVEHTVLERVPLAS